MPGGTVRGFAERVALVVGANGLTGVGRAVALQLALEGAFVVVTHAPNDAESASVIGSLREMGTLAHGVEADVRSETDVARIFAEVDGFYQRLDQLVFVADAEPSSRRVPFEDASVADVDERLNLNLRAAALCAQAGVRLMRARPSAGVVFVVGAAGVTGGARRAANADALGVAAGAGIIGLTEALAGELHPRVRVNCVAVGANTPGGANAVSVAPDEAARACLYLLSPEAKRITGQTLLVGSR